jgi:hypothetical protein
LFSTDCSFLSQVHRGTLLLATRGGLVPQLNPCMLHPCATVRACTPLYSEFSIFSC